MGFWNTVKSRARALGSTCIRAIETCATLAEVGSVVIEAGARKIGKKIAVGFGVMKQNFITWAKNKFSSLGPELAPDKIEKRPETLRTTTKKWLCKGGGLCWTAIITVASAGTAIASAERIAKVLRGLEKTPSWVNWIPLVSNNPALLFKVFTAVLVSQLAVAAWKAVKESTACHASAKQFWAATKELKNALFAYCGFYKIAEPWRLPAPRNDNDPQAPGAMAA